MWVAPAVVLALFAGGQLVLPRLQALAPGARVSTEFALDGYAAVDPSFRIGRDTLGSGTKGDAAAFYTYLRENAGIQSRAIEPVNIDFVDGWSHTSERPPHLFVFIIDSLRRDYLAAYNGAVTFTPAFDAFAADSFVFRRAFSRYAGTGLAVPAIWAGAMLIHKEYVTPFAPTNALEKLVAARGYRRLITEDHITDELFTPSAETIGLDHHVPEMLHTFCRTMGELGAHLEGDSGGAPLFVMTRPLDLHIGNIASATTPAGEAYPGFYGPYASRVRRIDACFGEFVATLKRAGLYDDSIIVVTSDHGDSLGEGQRWGHGFTAFPEVLRIPLMIHVPADRRARLSTDLTRLSFSTDITPTLYTLLGEAPAADRPRAETRSADGCVPVRRSIGGSILAAARVLPDRLELRAGVRAAVAEWAAVVRRGRCREPGIRVRSASGRYRCPHRHHRRRARSQSPGDSRSARRPCGVVPLHAGSLTTSMQMSPSASTLLGLTAIVACLVALLTFALLRFIFAARDTRRQTRSSGADTAILSAALQEAVAKLKSQERAMAARAEASERLSGEIISSA